MQSAWPAPLIGNPLRSRADVARMAEALLAPLPGLLSPGGARLRLGTAGAVYDSVAAELEGYARPLWGLAPLAAGGGQFAAWPRWRAGLLAGTDPAHPEFWGWPGDFDQRLVEMAPIGLALALVPERLLGDAPPLARARVIAWLRRAETQRPVDNNWWFFRLMVGLGLKRLGERPDTAAEAEAHAHIDGFHLGDGWYRDGPTDQLDHYVGFAFHYYGLVHAALSGDAATGAAFRARARAFAGEFRHWFGADGAALPIGRSLTYRFAQGAFWGALAFAGEEALPWGEIKGLYLRHLRWWAARPTILTREGLLSVGYAYASALQGEEYNTAASPYWALKAFLPLALPEDHPFWAADEAPDRPSSGIVAQPRPGLLLYRAGRRQVVALASGQASDRHRQAAAKYGKMAYSTVFGFSVESDIRGLERGCFDNTLALSDDGGTTWRQRGACEAADIREEGGIPILWSRWRPWPDVVVETRLVPAAPWHLRLHSIRSRRALHLAEGGFAIDRQGDDPEADAVRAEAAPGLAMVRAPAGLSLLCDLDGGRSGQVVRALPNTNLMAPRTLIPTLRGTLSPGRIVLRCAVLALPEGEANLPEGLPPLARLADGPLPWLRRFARRILRR
ncbi:DUF2264 domain-containing protein [Belnapia sp. T6]|uniref:DUF2264 domain-containing protein n=1 Tax=Belnapia mucosa TaxID=2804532 RepID=A0ABS1V0U6_9PROT|nr:DUF2264 domain-containing protein [Belnapia mucosa]MBL6455324.1 DUF2264 domain-containing protein [Belnapia mucosa]